MISQFFILSPQRGDTLIFRDYRYDIPRSTPEILHSLLNPPSSSLSSLPPIINRDQISYITLTLSNLLFVATTRKNVSPFVVLEFLSRVGGLIKDFCGGLSEEMVRLNAGLVYEILDEVLDYGYLQTTSTDELKTRVFEDPIQTRQENIIQTISKIQPTLGTALERTLGSNNTLSSTRPIISTRSSSTKKESNPNANVGQVYIDVIERVTASFAVNGMTSNAEITGEMKIKSYLRGSPEIHMTLSMVTLGEKIEHEYSSQHGLLLNNYRFHDSVDFREFESARKLIIYPQEGEFIAMNYILNTDVRLPFRIFPSITLLSPPNQMHVVVRIRCDIPRDRSSNTVTVTTPIPRSTRSVSFDLPDGGTAEYDVKGKKVKWVIEKITGGSEMSLRIKIIGIKDFAGVNKLEVGPVR
ncbi:487_t:CDS:2 [Paraglomus brasilianum]|uniref:487_t:CDS:1 n=1 Tax=Paraglomus brasilianum TaxID=144538 RepID=A0A9N8ZQ49_9GLOM|nr:487_t:CDS:2 [Paraglomus brasilianum]